MHFQALYVLKFFFFKFAPKTLELGSKRVETFLKNNL